MGLWAEFKFNADFKVETETFHGSQILLKIFTANIFQSFGVVLHFES